MYERREDVVLVLEVPVDGAAGYAGATCYLLERGLGDTLFKKDFFCGVEYGFPRRLRFRFGTSSALKNPS